MLNAESTERRELLRDIYGGVHTALRALAERHGLAHEDGDLRLAYQLFQRDIVTLEVFEAFDSLRLAYMAYTSRFPLLGPIPSKDFRRFIELAAEVKHALEAAMPSAAA